MAKIITDVFVKQKSDAETVLEELIKELANGNVTDFIVAARCKLTPEQKDQPEHKDTDSLTIQHWYGDTSCIHALGLANRMTHIINTYMDYCQILDEDENDV
jgi:hypothetical protein